MGHPDAAAVMAIRLREKGFLTLLGRGLYGLVPVANMGVGAAETSFALPSCITGCDSEGPWRCCAAALELDLCWKT